MKMLGCAGFGKGEATSILDHVKILNHPISNYNSVYFTVIVVWGCSEKIKSYLHGAENSPYGIFDNST